MNQEVFTLYKVNITKNEDTERMYGITLEVLEDFLPELIKMALESGNRIEITESRDEKYEEK